MPQHVSSLTNESLQSNRKKIGIPKRVGPVHSSQSDPSPLLQTEPDMSTARHRLKSCSVEQTVCDVGRYDGWGSEEIVPPLGLGGFDGSNVVRAFVGFKVALRLGGFDGFNVGRAVVGFKVGASFGAIVGMVDGWEVGWDVG